VNGERRAVDWNEVRQRLAARSAGFEDILAGGGPWVGALLDRRTRDLARVFDTDAVAGSPLLVAIGAVARYGLDLAHVSRVLPLAVLTPVPGAPASLLGLMAVDGRVVRLFDPDRLCGATVAAPGPGGLAVLLRIGTPALALRFHGVDGVAAPGAAPRPQTARAFVRGVTADRLVILDLVAVVDGVNRSGGA
jgi:purine-binding chemotaxis protein CheW